MNQRGIVALYERESDLLKEFEKLQAQTVVNKITLEVQQRLSELTMALDVIWEEMKSGTPEYVSLRRTDQFTYNDLRAVLAL